MSEVRRAIVINADDYGYTAGVCRGVVDAHSNGSLTTTTAMMNLPMAEESIAVLRQSTPDLGIGVHLNLTAGKPVLPAAEVASLVGNDGLFHSHQAIESGAIKLDRDEVAAEWEAQIVRLEGLAVAVDHLDSHHHISYVNADLAEVMRELAIERGIGVRRPPEADLCAPGREVFGSRASGVWFPQAFIGRLGFITLTELQNRLDGLQSQLEGGGCVEWMTHVAYVDDDLSAKSSYVDERRQELDLVIMPDLRHEFETRGLELMTFSRARSLFTQTG